MSAAINERLVAAAQAARAAPQGAKGAIYAAACAELGMSTATLHRKIKEMTVTTPRKRRSDAGTTALTRNEAMLISALWIESFRRTGKQQSALALVVERLRSNDEIRAAQTDPETGEVKLLSVTAINRALRTYGLHPEQLTAPAPAMSLSSLHPNHVWQIDASISTQFYLAAGRDLNGMPEAEFYKNKPENFKRIEKQRLWRYVITDHASGALYVEYVLGSESSENICNVFINAMQKRHESDPLHGVPLMIMTDPGAAMTSGMFRNLCRSLGVQLVINKVGNARAKGQVEQAHNLVETKFESGLKIWTKPSSLEEINGLAWKWMRYFNATAIHTRTSCPRYETWLRFIKPEFLRLAPPVAMLRELAVSTPEERVVSTHLTISYRGREFDVSPVPSVMVKQKLLVTRNPWRDDDSAQLVLLGEDGRESYFVVDAVARDHLNFRVDGATIGEQFKQRAETPAQTARKEIEQLITGTGSQEAAEAARKAKTVPFNGRIDPFKPVTDTTLPTYLPRLGTAMEPLTTVQQAAPLLSADAAMLRIVDGIGRYLTTDENAFFRGRFADGVPEDQIEALIAQFINPAQHTAPLAAAGGGLRAV